MSDNQLQTLDTYEALVNQVLDLANTRFVALRKQQRVVTNVNVTVSERPAVPKGTPPKGAKAVPTRSATVNVGNSAPTPYVQNQVWLCTDNTASYYRQFLVAGSSFPAPANWTVLERAAQVFNPTPVLSAANQGEAAWRFPGIGPKMSRAVEGLRLVEDLVFGSSATPTPGVPTSVAVKSINQLSKYFNPLEGEFTADGTWVGGTGLTTINSEPQRYRTTFDGQNHIMDADGLRLQTTVNSGTWDSYVRGQINTGGGGLNVNAPGGVTTTALADIGLTTGDLTQMSIGDVWTNANSGLMVVTAYNSGASTITFEAVSGGARTAYKGNWHVTGTKLAFSQVTANVVNGVTTSVTLLTPVPPQVVPGCFVMGVDRTSTPFYDPAASDRARVLTISPDRLTVTFDGPLSLQRNIEASNFDGLLFIPETWAGQLWSKRSYGPHRQSARVQAIRVEFTMPNMPSFAGGPNYTKAAVDAAMAAAPGTKWGYWPAIWTYSWRPGPGGEGQSLIPGARLPWSEIDILEVFVRITQGQNTWTGALHDQPFTRRRNASAGFVTVGTQTVSSYTSGVPFALLEACDNVTGLSGYLVSPMVFMPTVTGTGATLTLQRYGVRFDPGAKWLAWPGNQEARSPNSTHLLLSNSICSGTRRSVGIVWTRDKVIHYLDDNAVCESDWSVDTDYPHQLGLNVAAGSLTGGNCSSLFFPQSQADATGQFMTIHSVKTWEA